MALVICDFTPLKRIFCLEKCYLIYLVKIIQQSIHKMWKNSNMISQLTNGNCVLDTHSEWFTSVITGNTNLVTLNISFVYLSLFTLQHSNFAIYSKTKNCRGVTLDITLINMYDACKSLRKVIPAHHSALCQGECCMSYIICSSEQTLQLCVTEIIVFTLFIQQCVFLSVLLSGWFPGDWRIKQ